jgi:hypothetical protein
MTCRCQQPPFHYLDFAREQIGMDAFNADVSIDTCNSCGTLWLVYLIEDEHYTKSGRWWRLPISAADRKALAPDDARAIIERSGWCFVGGSFHNSTGFRKDGPIVVR